MLIILPESNRIRQSLIKRS